MRVQTIAIGALALGLAACEDASDPNEAAAYSALEEAFYEQNADARGMFDSAYSDAGMGGPAPMFDAPADSPGSEPEPAPDLSSALIAYSYEMELNFPADALMAAHEAHVNACHQAGRDVCQVVSTRVYSANTSRVTAFTFLRATPDWLGAFRSRVVIDAEAAGGQLSSSQTHAEDLTTRIVDGEARLQAQITLRNRLMELLETGEGDFSDLIELERQLSRVQAELDAKASVVARLQQRVQMSTLTLTYEPIRQVETRHANPVVRALAEAGGTFTQSIGHLIAFLIAFTPWLIIILPALWYGLRFAGRAWRGRKAKA